MKKVLFYLLLSLLFVACKKKIDVSRTNGAALVQEWRSAAIEEGIPLGVIDSVTRAIDPSICFSIPLGMQNSLLVLQTNSPKNGSLTFFGFLRGGSRIRTVGFFTTNYSSNEEATNVIRDFVNLGAIKQTGFVEVRNPEGQLIGKVERSKNGKTVSIQRTRISKSDLLYSSNTLKHLQTNDVDPDPIGPPPVCTDWYLVTYVDGVFLDEEYVYTSCESGGSGTGGTSTYEENSSTAADDGKLSCRSFTFTNMTTNMFEAGVSGLNFQIWVGSPAQSFTFSFRNIYVGVPSKKADQTLITAGQAAAYTAKAMNRAALSMALKYQSYTLQQAAALQSNALESEFRNLTQIILSNEISAGATVSVNQNGANTVTSPAVWNTGWEILFNGLTGSGCSN